jgi:hypothetical protein
MSKPVDIQDEVWLKSQKKAKTYLARAFAVFPDKSKEFYMARIKKFITADMIKEKGK